MKKALILTVALILMLAACKPQVVETPPSETVDLSLPVEPSAAPEPTPTETPPVTLTVCTASLPETLSPFGGPLTPARERLNALLYPPAYTLGNVWLEPVPIRRGQMLVDARGELVMAAEGVNVRPSGCRENACSITWNGLDPLEMDRMVVDFSLHAGLTWSDGAPLIPADVILSYTLASDPSSPVYGWAEARTESFNARDAISLSWRGLPGFTSAELENFFWTPLPSHRFDSVPDFSAVAAETSSYGPFSLAERGEHELLLTRNPGYPSPAETLPGVDQVVLRALEGGAVAAWEALQTGTCDALDASFNLVEAPEVLAAIQSEPGYEVRVETDGPPTQLVFGIRPAEYDTINNPVFAERKDFFADSRTRLALTQCIDIEALAAQTGSAPVLQAGLSYDPVAGATLLETVGWVDHDGDPLTPRVSQNVPGVFNSTPLSLTLLAGPSPFHQDLAAGIAEMLGICGVGLQVHTLSLPELYAPGPEGPLFGRAFDLTLLAWQRPPGGDCALYASWAIPNTTNGWIGTNIAGFSDAGYDALCSAALLATPEEVDTRRESAQAAFAELLPAVMLVTPVRVEVWKIDAGGW